jgi:hypothetical protein
LLLKRKTKEAQPKPLLRTLSADEQEQGPDSEAGAFRLQERLGRLGVQPFGNFEGSMTLTFEGWLNTM